MKCQRIRVCNPVGLHLQAAIVLTNILDRYQSEVIFTYERNGVLVNGNMKSILSIVAAGVDNGEELQLICNGEDETEAFYAVTQFLQQDLAEVI